MATPPAKKAAPKTGAANQAAKPRTGARAAAKAAGAAANAAARTPKAEGAPRAEVSKPTAGATLRAKDLIGRVAEATGVKIKDVREIVAATLAELGKSLDAGETLVLPPLGKLRITPPKTEGATGPMKLKLNRGAAPGARKKAAKEALAEGGEDS